MIWRWNEKEQSRSRFTDIAILAGILLFVALIYSRIPAVSYCGFDDFLEQHRLEGSLARPLSSEFTVQYYEGYKYRPLLWVMNRITYEWGSGSAVVFRIRNVAFHLANLILLYCIGHAVVPFPDGGCNHRIAIRSTPSSESIRGGGAMWAIVECAFLLLLSLLLFLLSARQKQRWFLLLALSFFCGWLGILSYEACISIFGLIYGYLAIRFVFSRTLPDKRFAVALVALTVLSLGSYFGLRALYLQPGSAALRSGLAPISVKNFAYIRWPAPLFLIDPVMANEWLDHAVALGSGAGAHHRFVDCRHGRAAVLPALSRVVIFRKRIPPRLQRIEWPELTFLLLGVLLSLSPFLLFNNHASETYLYVPMALFVLMMSRILCALLVGRRRSELEIQLQCRDGGPVNFVRLGHVGAERAGCGVW